MPDYSKGKIYKLWCPDNDLIYIGSTIQSLHVRLAGHKKQKDSCKSKLLFQASNEVKIELIEKFPCNDRMELNKREGELIRLKNCVNKVIAGRTGKEYYQDYKEIIILKRKEYKKKNKEEIILKNKIYREKNKDIINEKRREHRKGNSDTFNEKKKNIVKKKK